MKACHLLFGLALMLIVSMLCSVPAKAEKSRNDPLVNYTIDTDQCVTVAIGLTPPGSSWTMSALRATLGAVANPNGIYYNLQVGMKHTGTTGSLYENFFTMCNICPGGSLSVNIDVPGTVIKPNNVIPVNPQFYDASTQIANLGQYKGLCPAATWNPGTFDLNSKDAQLIVSLVTFIVGGVAITVSFTTTVAHNVVAVTNVKVEPAPAQGHLVPGAPASMVQSMGSLMDLPPNAQPIPQPLLKPDPTHGTDVLQRVPCPFCGKELISVGGKWYCKDAQCNQLRVPRN